MFRRVERAKVNDAYVEPLGSHKLSAIHAAGSSVVERRNGGFQTNHPLAGRPEIVIAFGAGCRWFKSNPAAIERVDRCGLSVLKTGGLGSSPSAVARQCGVTVARQHPRHLFIRSSFF